MPWPFSRSRCLYLLLLLSLVLLYYLVDMTRLIQTHGARLPPANTHSVQRSLMNGHKKQDETLSHRRVPPDVTNEPEDVPNDQAKNEVQHILSQDIPRKRRKYGRPTFINGHLVHRANKNSRRVGHSSMFSFEDMSPGSDRDPIKYGLHASAARLSYEFSGSPNASDVNSNKKIRQLSRILPKFSEKTAKNIKIVGNIPAGQIVPVESSRHILIATTWRSGSTFLGDLLNHYPGVFYYFEPLHYFDHNHDSTDRNEAIPFISSLFKCQFDNQNVNYLKHVSKEKNRFLFQHNFRLYNICDRLLPGGVMCFMPQYLNKVCPIYPIKLVKTVRLRVKEAETLLQDPSLDLKIVVLVRDPRGVYNSRKSMPWCEKPQCADPKKGCEDLTSDIKSAFDLHQSYPKSTHLIRFEDLSMQPEETTDALLKFLDLPWEQQVTDYINTHTQKDKFQVVKNKKTKKLETKKSPYGTARNSTATAFAWRSKLGFFNTTKIQGACKEPMAELGYKLIDSEFDLASDDLPIFKTASEVWPFGDK